VIANIGNGTNNSLVYLNGNSSALAFGDQKINTDSATAIATVHNIGNAAITLGKPFFSLTGSTVFSEVDTSTCGNKDTVNSAASCMTDLLFKPAASQTYAGQLSIVSNAYNDGTPVLILSGTGTATASLSDRVEDRMEAGSQRKGKAGRKSFQQNGTRRNFGLRQGDHSRQP
jgi:hypothetical protein